MRYAPAMIPSLILAAATLALAPLPAEGDSPARFAELVKVHDEWRLTVFPEYALRRGVEDRAGELTDTSLAGVHKRQAWGERFLEELRTVDPATLSPADARDYLSVVRVRGRSEGVERCLEGTLFDGR